MGIFAELADKGLYGCIPVVVADGRKLGILRIKKVHVRLAANQLTCCAFPQKCWPSPRPKVLVFDGVLCYYQDRGMQEYRL